MRRRDESGQTTIIIVTLAVVVMMTIAAAIDTGAAFLQRQRLDNLAEGAALYAADAAAEGDEVYTGGLGDAERLEVMRAAANAATREYLNSTGAYGEHSGLSYGVTVADGAVRVTVRSNLKLPISFPGVTGTVVIGATGASAVVLGD